jgi:N-acetylneuraminic acid mutarotase
LGRSQRWELDRGPTGEKRVAVADGQFSTTLDFGSLAFSGAARWIEIAVRPNGSADPHSVLTPRQQAGAIPYALHALDSARPSDLTTLSNNLAAIFADQLQSLSNSLRTYIPTGVTVASINPSDATLITQGLVNTFSIAAPSWANGTSINQPSARSEHTTIWTGREMIVWGGKSAPGSLLATGGMYRPDLDQWTAVSTISAPTSRSGHTAVWSGLEMIVWGGFGSSGFLASGRRFQPDTQRWLAIASANAPSERLGHVAVWSGSRVIVWGGRNNTGLLNDGAFYNPTTDVWSPLPGANSPSARHSSVAVWAGDRMLIWGGEGAAGPVNFGAQLLFDGAGNPTAWQNISVLNAPSARSGHTAIWTGSRLIIWGGANTSTHLSDGAIYNPAADTWIPIPQSNGPSARTSHSANWTGTEMIVWGGVGAAGSLATGAAYDPSNNTWRTLQNPGSPLARDHAGSIWTGAEFLIFGGLANGAPLSNLQRVNPQPTWHLYRKL